MTTMQHEGEDFEAQIDAALDVILKHDPAYRDRLLNLLDNAARESREEDYANIGQDIITIARQMEQRAASAQPKAQAAAKAAQKKARTPQEGVAPDVQGDIKRALGIAALVFGLCLWIPGAHYQLDGWTLIANKLLAMVRSGIELPLAQGWWALLLVPCGVLYSIGERRYLPLRKAAGRWRFLGLSVLAVWALVNGSDLFSAYTGIVNPPKDAGEWARWTAATPWAAIAWTLIVVYIGDMLIVLGWRWTGMARIWKQQRSKGR